MAEALRRCPDAVVVKPSFARYEADSARIMEILETASPMVEPLSIDEAFIELTGKELVEGERVATEIKSRLRHSNVLPQVSSPEIGFRMYLGIKNPHDAG